MWVESPIWATFSSCRLWHSALRDMRTREYLPDFRNGGCRWSTGGRQAVRINWAKHSPSVKTGRLGGVMRGWRARSGQDGGDERGGETSDFVNHAGRLGLGATSPRQAPSEVCFVRAGSNRRLRQWLIDSRVRRKRITVLEISPTCLRSFEQFENFETLRLLDGHIKLDGPVEFQCFYFERTLCLLIRSTDSTVWCIGSPRSHLNTAKLQNSASHTSGPVVLITWSECSTPPVQPSKASLHFLNAAFFSFLFCACGSDMDVL